MLGDEALERILAYPVRTVLDIGSGSGKHAERMRAAGKSVTTLDLHEGADIQGDYLETRFSDRFDAIWCCHVLEHQRNPGTFLDKCRDDLKNGGILAVTVPPLKHKLVGGHVSLWNEGVLIYHLVLAGFDCSRAIVGCYGYNVSAIVARRDIEIPSLTNGRGDLEALAPYFPVPVHQEAPGRFGSVGW